MKTKTSPSLSVILLLLFVLIFAQPVLAHGDKPRLEINPERLNPGAALDIRGVDFRLEEQVTLALTSAQTEIPFGTVLADAEGVFILTITLPVDTPEGIYIVRATTEDRVVESVPITISGMAVMEGGGQGERDEGDGLLAPMPTYAAGVSSTPLPKAVAAESAAGEPLNQYLLWVIVVVGIILVAAYIRMKRR